MMENMDKQQNLDRIHIVLVGTQDGANIGSVCRAMKTMGLTHLVMVTEREYAENRVKALAIHASDLYDERETYTSLKDALHDSVFSVAATRRRGKFRKATCMTPEQLAAKINTMGDGKISIVFGRESDGLTDEEVACCSSVVTIPSSDKFPSLNLSQAVQVITYTLFSNIIGSTVGIVPVTEERIGESAKKIASMMEAIHCFKLPEEEGWTAQFIHDAFSRAQLSEMELQKMEKMFTKMCVIARYKGGNQEETK